MKIVKFTKGKGNVYTLDIEGYDKVKLYDEIILKYNLLNHKEIDEEKLDKMISDNKIVDAYYKALKYITKRLRTKCEVYDYLKKIYTKKTTEETIRRLEKENYFDDARYLKSYINDAVLLSNKGPLKLIEELVSLGFEREIVEGELAKIDREVWLNKIERIVNKKLQMNHQYGEKKIKEKIQIDLFNLGYEKEDVVDVLNGVEWTFDNFLLMDKEYKKVFLKLSKKYSGEVLRYQLKMKLLQKGFSYEEIDDYLAQK